MAYQPIEDYGIVGDLNTVALIGMNGSVDWFCFPRFDSPASSLPFSMTRKAATSRSPQSPTGLRTNSSTGQTPTCL